jgi:NitT/TauT family transport system ATP-binding protein
MSMLVIEDVSKTFLTKRGRTQQATIALEGVNLSVERGEFCAIIGASGCGKSTLLRMIDGLTRPTSGRVLLHGAEITKPGRDRGVVFQHAHLLPWRTVEDNIGFGLECQGVGKVERAPLVRKYLEMVGLKGFEKHFPGQLSGGMQQRVGLARAFAIEPEMLLLDEPFGALDAQTRLTMQTELARIWAVEKRTAVLITHDIEEAVFLADRVFVMSSRPGRIVEVIDVPFPRPRVDVVRADPEFGRLKLHLWESLRSGMVEDD